jgi:hypothetical protein
MIKVGDLVEWGVLSIDPNDIAMLYERIKDNKRLENMPVTNLTTLEKHTGMVQNIEEGWINIIDFTGRCEVAVSGEGAYITLTKLNK